MKLTVVQGTLLHTQEYHIVRLGTRMLLYGNYRELYPQNTYLGRKK
ncbi:MAG: hypothetical protein AAFW73_18185 [Bacteroidota bacterium]